MDVTPLEKLIRQRGLKKVWIAEQCGITRSTLSSISAGKQEPTLRVALKIARLFDVSVEELWGWILAEEENRPDQ
ncbi:transcriptional regulator [Collibacillus ludicampi]|uniref:Transcriptional regulator n=1 Tax=Collibacillus ludicampi TaxID=2771369 RepID=A0AAV4LBV1_9BACL|nr:helix-turn-helix transcriptional regulator [Collibacillus ludicampi]GIM45225.1 transcriptional regulator [Collibacillus ludicampi]